MLFLLRAAFWLTIVLALLPSGGSQPTASGPKVSEALSAAGAAIADLRHFCTREPEACEVGAQTAVLIGQRAQAGAKMLYELINEHGGPSPATGPFDAKHAAAQEQRSMREQVAARGERR
ncbi:MAG TPA: DUF5330 domain-containing protein [Xanthobacteraceae bacterium]|nr:DUF5330 domain-containing protein [Xanthobacteraceae bacterium]